MKQTPSFLDTITTPSPIETQNRSGKNLRKCGGQNLIRFEEKRGIYIWAKPEEIFFIKSADHYVKSFVQTEGKRKWAIRHCSLKDILDILSPNNFIRLNRFYILNRNHFLSIDEKKKKLYFQDGSSVSVPHVISHFIVRLLSH